VGVKRQMVDSEERMETARTAEVLDLDGSDHDGC